MKPCIVLYIFYLFYFLSWIRIEKISKNPYLHICVKCEHASTHCSVSHWPRWSAPHLGWCVTSVPRWRCTIRNSCTSAWSSSALGVKQCEFGTYHSALSYICITLIASFLEHPSQYSGYVVPIIIQHILCIYSCFAWVELTVIHSFLLSILSWILFATWWL